MEPSLLEEVRLCYIKGDWAFFTSQSLEEQWGDDWNDAPYEHNAGRPYKWNEHTWHDKEPWTIVQVGFEVDKNQPAEGFGWNSPWCVRDINQGCVPWLRPWNGVGESLMAGATLNEFIEFIQRSGGKLWMPVS